MAAATASMFLFGVMLVGCPASSQPASPSSQPAQVQEDPGEVAETGEQPPAKPEQPVQPPPGERVAAVAKTDPLFERVEAASMNNKCAVDSECFRGGCSSEVCSAEDGVNTTCEMPANGWPQGQVEFCGCVASECVWFKVGGTAVVETKGAPQGQPCPDGRCADGLKCIEYFGVAGAKGPKFSSCEIPCPKGQCPAGQVCKTIADGPGKVCRAQ
jgi:hypothetical protein